MKKISIITAPRFRCFDPANSHPPTSIPTNHSESDGNATPDMARASGYQAKIVTGDAGYVLEDVPHLSDHILDLPVSLSLSYCLYVRGYYFFVKWSSGIQSKE
ncbi:phosphofructokinase 6 [Actinidia rufa]|uniref:Phosphofructokinase 6 n=1 Tax=Actinidia rufa TaxID=165716 RepID=A0A7J0FGQ4_9ERIC|nr:phosphofructokinase 6 [Actinidia rufa]